MNNLSTAFLFVVAVLAVPAVCSAVEAVSVPEPATSLLVAAGSLGVLGLARFRGRSK